jgi:hypothetical protein
MIGGGGMPEFY